jgi:tetratricopeptide (TPR) repeat protein
MMVARMPTHHWSLSNPPMAMRLIATAAIVFMIGVALGADELSQALAARRFEEVLRLADARLSSEPRDIRLWTVRGIALEGLQRLPESLASFERALEIDPQSLPALKGATEVAYRAKSPKAAALIDRVLKREPESATAHAMAGVLAVEAGRCAIAIDHFQRSGAALDANVAALTEYAGCLLRLDRPQEAVPVLEQAVRVSPGVSTSHYNLAVAQLRAGRADLAITAAESAVAMHPRDPDALNMFAAASAAAGQVAPAITALRKAIELAPDEERHYLDLAAVCLDHEALDLAFEIVNAGLARIASSARLYTMRGAIHAQRSDLENAMQDFEQAGALRSDELYGSVGLSLVLRQTAQFPEAIALLRKKLREKPGDATLNYLLGDALMRSDPASGSPEFLEAETAFGRALRAKPRFAKPHAALGKLYLRAGKPAAAVDELSAAVALDANDRLALNQLVMAYRQLGRQAEAQAAAVKLKALLDRERSEEAARNRVRLVRGGGDRMVPQP